MKRVESLAHTASVKCEIRESSDTFDQMDAYEAGFIAGYRTGLEDAAREVAGRLHNAEPRFNTASLPEHIRDLADAEDET